MSKKSFQDYYPEDLNYCYGCGCLNEYGLKIKSYWEADESVCKFLPKAYHMAIPGYVYGGLIASLIDCHGTGTAAAAAREQAAPSEKEQPLRFLTASLHVDFLKPTPLGVMLEVRGRVIEVKERKVIVTETLWAQGDMCARGEVVAVQVPENYLSEIKKGQ